MGSPSCPAADAVSCRAQQSTPGARVNHACCSLTALPLPTRYHNALHLQAQRLAPLHSSALHSDLETALHSDLETDCNFILLIHSPQWSAPAPAGPAGCPRCPCTNRSCPARPGAGPAAAKGREAGGHRGQSPPHIATPLLPHVSLPYRQATKNIITRAILPPPQPPPPSPSP